MNPDIAETDPINSAWYQIIRDERGQEERETRKREPRRHAVAIEERDEPFSFSFCEEEGDVTRPRRGGTES